MKPRSASYVPRILSDRILRFANQFQQKNPCTFAWIEYILWPGGEFRRKRLLLAWLRRNRGETNERMAAIRLGLARAAVPVRLRCAVWCFWSNISPATCQSMPARLRPGMPGFPICDGRTRFWR